MTNERHRYAVRGVYLFDHNRAQPRFLGYFRRDIPCFLLYQDFDTQTCIFLSSSIHFSLSSFFRLSLTLDIVPIEASDPGNNKSCYSIMSILEDLSFYSDAIKNISLSIVCGTFV